MRRALCLILTLVVATGTLVIVGSPAQAARAKVRVVPTTSLTVGWDGRATLVPTVRSARGVTLRTVRMTVRQSGRVVRAKARRASLPAGTYGVTVRATYRHRGVLRSVTKRFRTTVRQGACATAADYAGLRADPAYDPNVIGDAVATVAAKLRSPGTGKTYSPDEAVEVLQAWKVVMKDLASPAEYPAVVADLDRQISVVEALETKGLTTIENRSFPTCGGGIEIHAVFANGELFFADRESRDLFHVASAAV